MIEIPISCNIDTIDTLPLKECFNGRSFINREGISLFVKNKKGRMLYDTSHSSSTFFLNYKAFLK